MKPNKEQWNDIAKQLDDLFSNVYLLCDGFYILCGMKRTGSNKLEIVVYINGVINGMWSDTDTDHVEPKKFWRLIKKKAYTPVKRKHLEKTLGKRWCKKKGIYRTYDYYLPTWTRPQSFIKHLIANNNEIKMITAEQYRAGINQLEKR